MKIIIPCELMSEELTQTLRLKGQPYLIVIDKSKFEKFGIKDNHVDFELFLNKDKKLTLEGPTIHARPRGNTISLGVDQLE